MVKSTFATGLMVVCIGTPAAEWPGGTATNLAEACQIDVAADRKDAWVRAPKAESSVTQHRLTVGRTSVDYTATAGSLIIRDDDDKPMASIGYIAYTRSDAKNSRPRPITFALNGGPGSSSVWLHMGVLGPKRVVASDLVPTPPAPYRLVDNEFGMLDKSDVVMIDPVGTGISRAVCSHKDADFWGADADIDSISRFIAQYVTDNQRWNSPKYLLGESYGSARGAGIANYLRVHRSLALNGLILVSAGLDVEAIWAGFPGNDRPYAIFLPAFAAVAWYQRMLPRQPPALEPFLDEVRAYALGPFSTALLKGDGLSEAELAAVAEKVHGYTGLSVDYLKAANLRVSDSAFTQELLRNKRQTVGRLDGRFVGPTLDPLEKHMAYDVQLAAIGAAYTAAFQDYYHGALQASRSLTYRTTNFGIFDVWNWKHRPAGSAAEQPVINTTVDLAQALVEDANLKVLVLNGYYDLATPFSGAEYMMTHLGVPREANARIQMKYYEAGHMMYLHLPSLEKMKADLDAFIDTTAP